MKEVTGVPAHLMAEPATTAKAKNVLGKDDFMKLLMTQLRHQDPMKPMDHQEMATQLAQFGSLEQLSNIGAGIKDLRTGMGEGAKLQALGMIGKRVQAAGNEIELIEGNSVLLQNSLKADVKPMRAAVYDPQGKLVREIDLAGKTAETIQWDGKSTEGAQLPSGKYTFRVHGVDQNGEAQQVGTELSGRVTGVEMEGQNPILLIETPSGQTRLELAKVKQVGIDGEVKAGVDPAKPEAKKTALLPPKIQMPAEVTETPVEELEEDTPDRGHFMERIL